MSNRRRCAIAVGVTFGMLGAIADASAQTWPAKAVRVIVPFGPGGGTDIQGRLLAKKFYENIGQTFVIENRSGAGGMIGAEIVAKAPPDGYTLLFTTASLSVNVSLTRKPTFDPVKDLMPVSWVSSVPLVLVVHPSVPARNVRELVALAKGRVGKMNAGSNGSGTTSHLSIEMLRQMAGADAVHIAYKGGGPAMTALMSGEVDFVFSTALTAKPFIEQKRVRALAVTTAKPSGAFPGLPTMASLYPGFEADNWYAMFFPAGTSRDLVARMNAEIVKALKAADVRDYIVKEGGDPLGSSPEELAAYFRREVEKYAKVIKAGNIQAE